ncbi:hypothetical protein GCM10018980_18210 [Streptomyces capoamus]|uniref:Uncharacterized protein n=1 Tax=Streptomyces capoamus TaxID=68183 RepID=A0A919EUQ3_9ACTN|nr:hypothetical protein [Streptomyces capoamus]GGW16279.1 hypothetical protein GCM10010501_31830 [Streptomyces libani subsp. rufus]GHG42461.1 hypothetical protein GCM10018980_18210 [Streptomyces capoamus]
MLRLGRAVVMLTATTLRVYLVLPQEPLGGSIVNSNCPRPTSGVHVHPARPAHTKSLGQS